MCVDLAAVASTADADDVAWPEPAEWLAAVRASPLLGEPPVLRLYDDRLHYLDRYWREEDQVCTDLAALLTSTPAVELPALERLFPAGFEEQRQAAKLALSQQVTVLTGGPAPARPPPSHGCSRCWPSRPKPLGRRGRGSRWRHRPARRRRGCRRRWRWSSTSSMRPTGRGWASCRR
ncbi:putative exodeoxyribonuclease V alpha subunit [Mycobacterium xenopi 4042]|uniref:Putative exodeoxyribonuclease V alpha subunit n=1 Tax=Mycobacterium xenopi 4042 TaxID=1299334 RepID=X8C773_MYCXE|nr:putative exodeoxyribonuclease V alpha subunit [Mycobacterium xenopi 4042]